MPLSPAPLVSGASPLSTPGERPPARRARLVAAIVAVSLLLVALVLGSATLPQLLFVAPMLQAQAGGGRQAGGGTFQGFAYPWTRRMSGGGYTSPDSARN